MRKFISEGTKSLICGCHDILHPIWVLWSWKKIYKKWPKCWEVVCIFLHDIGHIGLNYLSDVRQKDVHWVLGAQICRMLFGQKGFDFVAGHVLKSEFPKSRLFEPDKYSWTVAPLWWMRKNNWVENLPGSAEEFKSRARENVENGFKKDNHDLHLELLNEKKKKRNKKDASLLQKS